MARNKISIENTLHNLKNLDEMLEELNYLRGEIASRLTEYKTNPHNIENRIALQSHTSYYERFIQPAFGMSNAPIKEYSESLGQLKFFIDKNWQAYEFHQFFQAVDIINKLYVFKFKLQKETKDLNIYQPMVRLKQSYDSGLYYYLNSREEIYVTSISFSSPGDINFEGLGEVVKEVRELLHYVVTFQWVKGIVDTFDQLKYDKPIERSEKRLRLRQAVNKEEQYLQTQNIDRLDTAIMVSKKMIELSKVVEELDKRGLADGEQLEETLIRSIDVINKLSLEKEKLAISFDLEEDDTNFTI